MHWNSVHSLDKPTVVNVRLDVCVGGLIQAIKVESRNELFLALLPIFFDLVLCGLIRSHGEGIPVSPIFSADKLCRLFAPSGRYSTLSGGF